jgi:hypothetical protein
MYDEASELTPDETPELMPYVRELTSDVPGLVVGYVRRDDRVMEPDGMGIVGRLPEAVETEPEMLRDGVMVTVLVRVVR